MEPGPDLLRGVVRCIYMDDVFGLYAVHTNSEQEQVNGYFDKVAMIQLPAPTSVECGGKVKHRAIPGASDHY